MHAWRLADRHVCIVLSLPPSAEPLVSLSPDPEGQYDPQPAI